MKFSKLISILSASVMFQAIAIQTSADNIVSTPVESTFSEFNKNDVNGTVTVTLPAGWNAEIDITMHSPDGDYKYYSDSFDYSGNNSYSFDIEGYDCEKGSDGEIIDGREYSISITAYNRSLSLLSNEFSDKFTVSDPDYNPDSRTNFNYNISIEELESSQPWTKSEKTSNENGIETIQKDVLIYAKKAYPRGDVNDDGNIDAVDASLVLTEYAAIATNKPTTMDAPQKVAADVDYDGTINAVDASKILAYYAYKATGKQPSWD